MNSAMIFSKARSGPSISRRHSTQSSRCYAIDGSPVFYEKWMVDRAFLILPAVDKVARYLATYKEFPPRQRPASFSIDQVVDKLNASIKSAR